MKSDPQHSPAVTVLMAVYNGERYLREAIAAILGQTYGGFEFLIVNDGSTDASRDIILSHDDERVRLLDNEGNIGLTRSLNRGLREATGRWIIRADADDWSAPDRIAAQMALAESGSVDVCFCDIIEVEPDGTETPRCDSAMPWVAREWVGLFLNAYGAHPASCFRRDAVLTLNGYEETCAAGQDYDLWDRCVAAGLRFGYVARPLVKRRRHEQSVTSRSNAAQHETARRVSRRAMRGLWPELSESEVDSLRWILQGEYTERADRSHVAGFRRCRGLVRRFVQSRPERGAAAEVWARVAESLQWRVRKVATWGDRCRLLALWAEAAVRAKGRYRPPLGTALRWLTGRIPPTK